MRWSMCQPSRVAQVEESLWEAARGHYHRDPRRLICLVLAENSRGIVALTCHPRCYASRRRPYGSQMISKGKAWSVSYYLDITGKTVKFKVCQNAVWDSCKPSP